MNPAEFERRMQEGIRLEQSLRWEEAEAHYAQLVQALGSAPPSEGADVRLRRANALLQLRRFEEAQREFDGSLEAAKSSNDPLVRGRALVGAGVFAASRNDPARGEEFLVAALDAFHEAHGREGVGGEGWALVNLAAIYGRTKRLDLAFLTFQKARERLFAVENWVGVATAWEMQAQLRERLGDADRAAGDYHEAMAFFVKQGMAEKVEEIRARLGGRRVV